MLLGSLQIEQIAILSMSVSEFNFGGQLFLQIKRDRDLFMVKLSYKTPNSVQELKRKYLIVLISKTLLVV